MGHYKEINICTQATQCVKALRIFLHRSTFNGLYVMEDFTQQVLYPHHIPNDLGGLMSLPYIKSRQIADVNAGVKSPNYLVDFALPKFDH